MSVNGNGSTSSADDFKRMAEASAFHTPELVVLPSGLRMKVQRPKPFWWALQRGHLPQSVVSKALGTVPEGTEMNPEDLVSFSQFTVTLLESMVVEPVIRRNPKEGEVDPNWITDDDLSFLLRYTGGEISAVGASLETFRGQPDSAAAGSSSPAVELSPKSDIGN